MRFLDQGQNADSDIAAENLPDLRRADHCGGDETSDENGNQHDFGNHAQEQRSEIDVAILPRAFEAEEHAEQKGRYKTETRAEDDIHNFGSFLSGFLSGPLRKIAQR
ncbi:MAG: hypothetical protein K2X27_09480, partial [Candidatus Obscuribacterales bacterium]|nr:hypothetical protein [Candidatus Obscuribacterales bacterium]